MFVLPAAGTSPDLVGAEDDVKTPVEFVAGASDWRARCCLVAGVEAFYACACDASDRESSA